MAYGSLFFKSDRLLATKKDINEARLDIHRLDKKMAVVQWMLGIIIAAQALPLFQAVAAVL